MPQSGKLFKQALSFHLINAAPNGLKIYFHPHILQFPEGEPAGFPRAPRPGFLGKSPGSSADCGTRRPGTAVQFERSSPSLMTGIRSSPQPKPFRRRRTRRAVWRENPKRSAHKTRRLSLQIIYPHPYFNTSNLPAQRSPPILYD